MSHIALNAHLLSLSHSYRGAGISWYILHLLKNLGQVDPELRYTVFLHDRTFQESTLKLDYSSWPTQRPMIRILWEQLVQPMALRRAKVDLLHAMAFVAPIVMPCPFVVTVYDLSFLRFPYAFRPFNRWYLSHLTAYSVKRAKTVIAISKSTGQDIINLLGKPVEQVQTIYCGVDSEFCPLPMAQVTAFKARHRLPDRFILFLGTLEPRKNIDGLICAYAAWRKYDQTAPPLVIAGGKGWYYQQIFQLVESLQLTGQIYFPGYVPQKELPLWYNAATLFVYPSHFEGFGLPVLESMACGTPIITSNNSSLPEVAGSAGLLIDSTDSLALTEAMVQVMSQPDLRASMREQGLVQAAKFRWDKTAHETVAVYKL